MRKLHGNPWAILVVVSLGFFMTLLDKTNTSANTSLTAECHERNLLLLPCGVE